MPYYHHKRGKTMVIFREGWETGKADSNMKFKKPLKAIFKNEGRSIVRFIGHDVLRLE